MMGQHTDDLSHDYYIIHGNSNNSNLKVLACGKPFTALVSLRKDCAIRQRADKLTNGNCDVGKTV